MTLSIVVTAMLLILSALHVYWAHGGLWPGKDAESLALTVVGGRVGTRFPGPVACYAVALVLLIAALLVAAASGAIALPLPQPVVNLGAIAVGTTLLVRGLGGFFDARLRPVIAGTPYARLNVRIYSPLALTLGALTLVAVI